MADGKILKYASPKSRENAGDRRQSYSIYRVKGVLSTYRK